MAAPGLKGPIKIARFTHRAILREAADFQLAASGLHVDDEQAPARLKERLQDFERILNLHEDAEGLVVFPPLESRYRYIADTYEFDHQRHRQLCASLVSTLGEFDTARKGLRRDLVKLLSEQATAFRGFMDLHIEKEDVLLFPTYDDTFSPEEQGVHFHATDGVLDEADITRAYVWGFRRLEVHDREAFLREMQAAWPREAFAGLSKDLAIAVSADDWQVMINRIPDLGQS